MESFDGKHVWIIGASSGIGRALAVVLASKGAVLLLSSRNEEKLDLLRMEIGERHRVYPLDVTDTYKFTEIANGISSEFTHIDSIIVMSGHYQPSDLEMLDTQEADDVIDINLKGALNAIHAVMPILKKQEGGQFALCGSVAGYRGLPHSQPYAATKAAIISLAESLKAEMGKLGIDIRIINPGFVRTPMTDKNTFPMPLMIEPEQAAHEIAKGLLSDSFEIHFPKRFTYLMKTLKFLPDWLYFRLVSR